MKTKRFIVTLFIILLFTSALLAFASCKKTEKVDPEQLKEREFVYLSIKAAMGEYGLTDYKIMNADPYYIYIYCPDYGGLSVTKKLSLIKRILAELPLATNEEGTMTYSRLIYVEFFLEDDQKGDRYFYISKRTSDSRKRGVDGGLTGVNNVAAGLYYGKDSIGECQEIILDR